MNQMKRTGRTTVDSRQLSTYLRLPIQVDSTVCTPQERASLDLSLESPLSREQREERHAVAN